MTSAARSLLALLSLALVAATPPARPTEIPWAEGEDEALVVPAASPVRFARFDEEHAAHFNGRFVLTGTFVYGCEIECEKPIHADQLYVDFYPDRQTAAVLPHWKLRNGDMRIYLSNGDQLARLIVTRRERAAILAGKITDVRKHISIVADDFQAAIECDSASYSARFVARAKPVQIARAKLDGNYGCG